eukprot:1320974-Amphidinium_carterae.4
MDGIRLGTGSNSLRSPSQCGVFDIHTPAPRPCWRAACNINGRVLALRGGASFSRLVERFDALLSAVPLPREHAAGTGPYDDFPDDLGVLADHVADETAGVHLPTIISWNSRALFSADADAARAKLRALASLQGKGDVLCIQETHQGRGAESAVVASSWTSFASTMSSRAGGVLILLKRAWLSRDRWRAEPIELVRGRALAVRLTSDHVRSKLLLLCVHLEQADDQAPADVLRTVGNFVQGASTRKEIVIGSGDLNFDMADDRIDAHGRILSRRGGNLARIWQQLMGDYTVPMCEAPTHVSGDHTLSTIDFHFLALAPASVSALGGHAFVIGEQQNPPGRSDHWPLCLKWRAKECQEENATIPRWVQQESLWQHLFRQLVEESFQRVERWQSGWLKLQLCAEAAFTAYKRETAGIPSDNIAANFLASGKALRFWWQGRCAPLRKLLTLAPHWGISPSTSWALLRGRLEILHGNLVELQLIERMERANTEEKEETDEREKHRAIAKSTVLSKLFAEWRKRRSSAPCITLVSSDPESDGQLLSEPSQVAAEIARHWSGTFAHSATADADAMDRIALHAFPIEWPDVQYSEEECAAVLRELPSKRSAPGPDGLLYSTWLHGGRPALQLLHHGYQAWLANCAAPKDWFSSILVAPVKGEILHPRASDLRPLCLENCGHKVHASMLNRRLLLSMPRWCFAKQRGFVPGRRLEHNLLDIEYSLLRVRELTVSLVSSSVTSPRPSLAFPTSS